MRASPKPGSKVLFGWLFVGFTVVVAVFVTSSVIAERAGAAVDSALFSRLQTAVPRQKVLVAARDDLLAMEGLFLEPLLGATDEDTRPRVEAQVRARETVDSAIAAFLSYSSLTDQSALRAQIDADLKDLDEAAAQATARFSNGNWAGAREVVLKRVRPMAERVGGDLTAFVMSNAAAVQKLAAQRESDRVITIRLTYALDAFAVIATVVVVLVMAARLRRYIRMEAAHERIESVRSAELEGFAGRVAHDVLSPLAAVGLALGAARRSTPADKSATICRGEHALKRVQALVDGLLEFARSGGVPDPDRSCGIQRVLSEIVEDARSRAPEFSLELEPVEDCAVRCAPGVLASIMLNLLGNAMKYTAGRPVEAVRVRARRASGSVCIEVEDTGPGVRPGEEDFIFLPNARGGAARDRPGIGLGLATVKRLVEAHGGRVGVRSRFGEGLLVWFELPRVGAVGAQSS